MMKLRIIVASAAVWTALAAAPALAAGTVTMANGGLYFTANGPSAYWHYDQGQGYCGHVASWCAPANSQWTYINQAAGDVNWATWRNPAPVNYPEIASAFIPARNATAVVKYTLRFNNGSYRSTYIDQKPFYDQWVRLNDGAGLSLLDRVMLGDQSYWGYASDKVAFDEIKIEN
ncbi:MAG TPA: hypothetical protein VL500_02285 [Candidatus Eisenbacteria bacterium]|jgi:hypothetical protein|nr:hypothetical protein [Candidatus Eisenbacteria bacterium]